MEHSGWLSWAKLATAALLIGMSKTGFPGAGILAIPLVTMVTPALLPDHPEPAKASTGLVLPMLIVGDIFAVAFYRRHAVWKHLVKLIPFAALGIVGGYLVMHLLKDAQVKPIIGSILLAMLVMSWLRQWSLRRTGGTAEASSPLPAEVEAAPARGWVARAEAIGRGWWFPVCMGLLAGVTTMMANAAGPIMIIYLTAMRLPKNEFLGTGAWYFLLLNCFKVPFSGDLGLITPASIQINLCALPVIVVGALLGVRVLKIIPEKGFAIVVQALAAVGAAWLAFGALIPKGGLLK